MRYSEEYELNPNWNSGKQMKTGKSGRVINYSYDECEYDYSENVTLSYCIESQIVEKTFPQNFLIFVIRENSFKNYKQKSRGDNNHV